MTGVLRKIGRILPLIPPDEFLSGQALQRESCFTSKRKLSGEKLTPAP